MCFLWMMSKLFKVITQNGANGATVLPIVGLARGSEQGTVPVPLRLLEEWTVRLLEWTETLKVVRSEHAQLMVTGEHGGTGAPVQRRVVMAQFIGRARVITLLLLMAGNLAQERVMRQQSVA